MQLELELKKADEGRTSITYSIQRKGLHVGLLILNEEYKRTPKELNKMTLE